MFWTCWSNLISSRNLKCAETESTPFFGVIKVQKKVCHSFSKWVRPQHFTFCTPMIRDVAPFSDSLEVAWWQIWARGSFMSFLFHQAWAPILPLGFACFAPQAPICVPLIVPCAAMRATWFWSATHHNTWGWSGQRGLLQQIMMMTIVSIIEGGQLMITLTTPTTFTIRRKGECTWRCFGCWDADLHYSDRKNMQNFGLRHLHSPHPLESYFSKYCKTILPLTSHCCFGDKWKLDGKLLDYRKTGHARHIFGP